MVFVATLAILFLCQMKILTLFSLLLVVVNSTFAQSSKHSATASLSSVDRLAIVKNSIELTEWHEKSFWAQYNTYLTKMQDVTANTYGSMEELANVSKSMDSAQSSVRANRMLKLRRDELEVLKSSYFEIGRDHNGVIALQFLQTETQLDIMECLNIYEHTYLRAFRLNPGFLAPTKMIAAKYNVISKAIGLTAEEAEVFFPVYTRYQLESDDVLGRDYSLYELFAGPASDYPPGLAKRLGYDLLIVMQRELNLKEKYYAEISRVAGHSVAARFLAWEDYYSVVCKMTLWAGSN